MIFQEPDLSWSEAGVRFGEGMSFVPMPGIGVLRLCVASRRCVVDRHLGRGIVLDTVLKRVDAQLDSSLERLFQFLRIPSISTDPAYAADCRRAAEFAAGILTGLGLEAKVYDTAGHPVVLGRTDTGAARRVLFYGHYDVQPVDPLDLWNSPPFEPRMAQDEAGRRRIVARGACDDKGQVFTFLEALRALKDETGRLPLDVTVLLLSLIHI